jgi:O-antigen/teichoic acid export membrane protein
MKAARNFAIVALIALGFAALPGGRTSLNVILAILTALFFTAIALLGYRLYREHRFTLDALETTQRAVLYGSIGLAVLTFAASGRLLHGAGVLVWLGLLALATYGVFWVFQRSRRYD